MQVKKIVLLLLMGTAILTSCTNPSTPGEKKEEPIAIDSNKIAKAAIDFKFDKAIAFVTINPIMDYGREPKNDTIKDSVSIVLSPSQIQLLNKILVRTHPPADGEDMGADCFNPRHYVYFLNEAGKRIHFIAVCFECGNRRSSIVTRARLSDFAEFFDAIGFPNYYDFSEHVKHYSPLIKKRE